MFLLVTLYALSSHSPHMSIVRVESEKSGFDPLLVAAVIYHESKFSSRACFRGAHGLMQIQLKVGGKRTCAATKALAMKRRLYDPRTNIREGLRLMGWWRGWWKKHHSNADYHWLLFYNQGFGRCPPGKKRCPVRERNPVTTGRRGGYADRVLEIYDFLQRKGRAEI